MRYLAVALGFLGLNLYIYNFFALQAVVPARESFHGFPRDFGEWHCDRREWIDAATLANLGATDYWICNYVRPGYGYAGLYLGYHATQIREEGGGSGENSIHPPAHCLPGSGWDIIDSKNVALDGLGLSEPGAKVKRLVIAKGADRQLVYYWYQTQGRVIADDWKKILFTGYARATRGRTDGALVRFTIPIPRQGEEPAERAFHDLAAQVVPILGAYLPN